MSIKTQFLNNIRRLFKTPIIEKWFVNTSISKKSDGLFVKTFPKHILYPFGTIRVVKRWGIDFTLDISNYVDWSVYFQIVDEGHEKVLFPKCKKDYVVLDIGTHIGSVAMRFAQLVGNNGKAYGFEPDPFNYEKCKRNLQSNHFPQLEIHNIGLGSQAGEFILEVDSPDNLGHNHIVAVANPDKKSYKVQITTLDEFCKVHQINHIDLIKIDIEGYELKALEGGIDTLKRLQPIIFIEICDDFLKIQKNSGNQVIVFLESLGYEVKKAITGENVTSSYVFSENEIFDAIALPKNKI